MFHPYSMWTGLCLAGLLGVLQAQAFPLAQLTGTGGAPVPVTSPVAILPSQGLWWSVGENGQFMQVQIGAGGVALITLSDSDPAGTPRYRVLQGTLDFYDAGSTTEGIARVESPLYEVRDAGCLECGAGAGGQTRVAGPVHVVRFISASEAELIRGPSILRRYRSFPLYSRAADSTLARFGSRELLLSAWAGGRLQHAQVRLQAVDLHPRCAPGASADTREFVLQFQHPERDAEMVNTFGALRFQLSAQEGGTLSVKALVDSYALVCGRPVALCATQPPQPTGTQICAEAYRLQAQGDRLRGAAVPSAGADVLVNGPNPGPIGPARFTGGLTLSELPWN